MTESAICKEMHIAEKTDACVKYIQSTNENFGKPNSDKIC
jgi:hypothetical protein